MSIHATFQSLALADPHADHGHEAPPGHTGATPGGLALADALVEALGGPELEVPNRWVTPDGHAFEVRAGGRFDVTLALDGPRDEGRFRLQLEGRRGLLARRKKAEPRALPRVARALHEALSADPRISEVRWFGEEGPDEGSPEPPV